MNTTPLKNDGLMGQWRDTSAMTLKEMRGEHQQLVESLDRVRRLSNVIRGDDPTVTARIRVLVAAINERRHTLLDGTIWQRTQEPGYQVPPVALMIEEALEDEEESLIALTTFGQGYPEYEERQGLLDLYSRPRLKEVQQELRRRKGEQSLQGRSCA